MLVKLSVILVFFVAISFGQTPDCKVAPTTRVVCCRNLPDYYNKEIADACDLQLKTVGPPDFTPSCERVTCFMKKNNHLLSDSKIDKAAFTKFVKMNLIEWPSTTIDTSVQKCYKESETAKCIPQTFLFCVMITLMKECPTASWLKTEECTILKKYFDGCPNADIYNI